MNIKKINAMSKYSPILISSDEEDNSSGDSTDSVEFYDNPVYGPRRRDLDDEIQAREHEIGEFSNEDTSGSETSENEYIKKRRKHRRTYTSLRRRGHRVHMLHTKNFKITYDDDGFFTLSNIKKLHLSKQELQEKYKTIGDENKTQEILTVLSTLLPNFCTTNHKINIGIANDKYKVSDRSNQQHTCNHTTFIPVDLKNTRPVRGRAVYSDWFNENNIDYLANNDAHDILDPVLIIQNTIRHCRKNIKTGQTHTYGLPILITSYATSNSKKPIGAAHANMLIFKDDGDHIDVFRYEPNGNIFYGCVNQFLTSLFSYVPNTTFRGGLNTYCPNINPQYITRDSFCVVHAALFMFRFAMNANKSFAELQDRFYTGKTRKQISNDVKNFILFIDELYTEKQETVIFPALFS